jgi:hypothetical protein
MSRSKFASDLKTNTTNRDEKMAGEGRLMMTVAAEISSTVKEYGAVRQ